ncbi:hypothetical protein SLA2020_134320 [Shorea laevis]
MKRSRKSNRVSWAPDVNLCQVKLFLMADCPSKVGVEPEVNLKAKSWTSHPSGMYTDDLPPGFEHGHCFTSLKNVTSHIPRIQWKCPPKFVVNPNWQVVAGEESEEVEAEKLRESRVLEAVYPRLSSVPPSPSVLLDIKDEYYDDSQTLLVPLTPIEDEEDTEVPSAEFPPQANTSQGLYVSRIPNTAHHNGAVLELPANEKPATGISPDAMVAASAVLTTIMKSKGQGSMIDADLLVKILSDPKTVETLVKDHRAPLTNANAPVAAVSTPTSGGISAPSFVSKSATAPAPLPCPKSAPGLPPMPLANRNLNRLLHMVQPVSSMTPTQSSIPNPISTTPEMTMVSASRTVNGNVYYTPKRMQPAISLMPALPNSVPQVQPTISTVPVQPNSASPFAAPAKPNPVKDTNYFKNLIREHGREKQEKEDFNIPETGPHYNHMDNQVMVQNLKSGQLKLKNQKPCLFFSTAKGCRNGTKCPYVHDFSGNWRTGNVLEAPNAKRMKLSGEITGR